MALQGGVQVIGQQAVPFRRRRRRGRRVRGGQNAELATILALLQSEFDRRDQFDFLNLQSENTQKAIRLQAKITSAAQAKQNIFLGEQAGEARRTQSQQFTDILKQTTEQFRTTSEETARQGVQGRAGLQASLDQILRSNQREDIGLQAANPATVGAAVGIPGLETGAQASLRVGGDLQTFQTQGQRTAVTEQAGATEFEDALQALQEGRVGPATVLHAAGNVSAELIRNIRFGDPGSSNQSRINLSNLRSDLAKLRPDFAPEKTAAGAAVSMFGNLTRSLFGLDTGQSRNFAQREDPNLGIGKILEAELFQIDRALKSGGGLNVPPNPELAGAKQGVVFEQAVQQFIDQSGVLQPITQGSGALQPIPIVEENPTVDIIQSPLLPPSDGFPAQLQGPPAPGTIGIAPLGQPETIPGNLGAGLTPDNLGRLLARKRLEEMGLIA